MKAQYRELIESIIGKKQKLAEAKGMQVDAKAQLAKADGYVSFNEASLKELEGKLADLEALIFGSESKALI
ncbi:hypothetical protein ACIPIN_01970 [Pseudomonas sp. NPDC087697]|uniref:hypothetical protein n=1 Tax=Pseudomonas sp. NPDC087697 TaxID=3364447 RepID=UPI003801E90C